MRDEVFSFLVPTEFNSHDFPLVHIMIAKVLLVRFIEGIFCILVTVQTGTQIESYMLVVIKV